MRRVFDRGSGRRQLGVCQEFSHAVMAALLCIGVGMTPALAIQPQIDQPDRIKPARTFLMPELDVKPDLEASIEMAAGRNVPGKMGAQDFLQRHGGSWELRWDRRTDRPNLIQGSGIPLIPGKGNTLTASGLGLAVNDEIDIATVETRLRDFIADNEDLLQTRGLEFRLTPDSSTPYGDGSTHWFIELGQYANGVRVDRAHLFFRLSHGNIVQFGEELVAPVKIDTHPSIERNAAFKLAWSELGFPPGSRVSETIEAGELVVLPVALNGEQPGQAYAGASGSGYAHRLAWRFVFRVDRDPANWEVLFDAHTQSVLEVRDLTVNVAATVTGGIYPTTNTDSEIVVNMPFAAVTNSGAKVTDALGIYDYSGGTATTALDGKHFKMSDNCGAISLSSTTDGNLALGTSGGTDCTTPGVGGAGNTHASRSGFYHLTNINRKAALYLPSNTWVNTTKVTANMNINDVCNAYWGSGTLNFFKSGTSGTLQCSNTGEIAAVFLHEWGHGLDTNTGGSANEYGSGEAVGDTFAFLETRDSCIGANFTPGRVCHNCTTCTGVRDVKDFGLGGTRPIARPSNIAVAGGIACTDYIGAGNVSCPYTSPTTGAAYRGPMGYEGHCESLIASSANWDLTQSLITKHGVQQGWQEMDRIWYGSLVPSKSAYQVAAGGTCNANATVNGCGSSNWYTVFLAADDDDGNLANGTPNACRIWDAFDAHGIACGTRPVCSNDSPDFNLNVTPATQTICTPGSATYTIAVGSQMAFANAVTLTASGLPAGVAASFAPNPVIPGNSATMTVFASGAIISTQAITVSGVAAASPGHSAMAELKMTSGVPSIPVQSVPANGSTGVARQPVFTWNAIPAAVSYTIEIASDAIFTTIIQTGTSSTASWTASAVLTPSTTYYWRVRANSPCGNSAVSVVSSFTTGVTFPEPYCNALFPSNVEPISRVVFAGFDKPSSATLNGTPALEDFTATLGTVTAGTSTTIAVQGNTGGNYTTYVSAYADWNRNGTFDASEGYNIGSISNSTGSDGKQASGPIAVPAGALAGATRLRVIKKYAASAAYPAACNTTGYGQAEDYTLNVVNGTSTYTVGGTVSGLSGTGLKLSLNGGTDLAIAANGSFTLPGNVASGASYAVTITAQPSAPTQVCTLTNGSGTMPSANVTNVAVNCAASNFTVGGMVSGLSGTGLKLSLNGGADLAITANGSFTLPGNIASGASYAVAITAQPSAPTQVCTLANGSGTMPSANVTNVEVSCAASSFTVGGMVSGLSGTGLKLSLNGGADLAITANGSFTLPGNVASGASYTVAITAQPSAPTQVCTLTNGSGTMPSANVTNVVVNCAASSFTVGGMVSGLSGTGLKLSLNGGADLAITANGSFTLPGNVASGASYAVAITAQPSAPTQICTLTNGSGTMPSANVTDVVVNCVTSSFTVGGMVSGLSGTGFKLSLNSGADLAITGDGSFTLPGNVASGASYTVAITAQPGNPSQICTLTNGSGMVTSTNVTNVLVNCVTSGFTVGGTVSGLAGSGLKLRLNSGANLTVSANGSFTFPSSIASGASYAITITSQPLAPQQTCTLANASGTVVAANVSNVMVTCVTDILDRIFANGFELAAGGTR